MLHGVLGNPWMIFMKLVSVSPASPCGPEGLAHLSRFVMARIPDYHSHQPITCKAMGGPLKSWSFAEYTGHLIQVQGLINVFMSLKGFSDTVTGPVWPRG